MNKVQGLTLVVAIAGLGLGAGLAAAIRSSTGTSGKVQRLIHRGNGAEVVSTQDSQTDRTIALEDDAEPGSDFYEFRQRLRAAVAQRDRTFVESVLPEQLPIGFSVPRSRDALNLEESDSWFWAQLQKAIDVGCSPAENPPTFDRVDADTQIWVCPNVVQTFVSQFPPPEEVERVSWQSEQAIVVGENVNVRSQPTLESEAIASVSNAVVTRDREQAENMQQASGGEIDPIDGWTPVILAGDRRGYIYNQYVYTPLDYQILFGKVEGDWQILAMAGGE
ncbi:SH3 domain-containing protein [Oxynema aestuarii]|uniref:SH3 domain-containing protein n=1 Tax=Oxynema aestuarii AP17 TaxID=2064643 RepID=A0A6H1U0E1_9CYAN|nr:SH3 domain-containing protein [Oxynema aestuarii]QIZ72332.1 SH3 domain-containing protein [Oxynema aestuarii AP17]